MALTHLTDFSDRLSPMLVKELRQGLRAKTFIGVFLSLQAFLAVMMFSATAASGSDRAGSMVSGIIFSFFAIAVLIVQPLRGISALSSEAKSNTLDMMSLTRLSSWKIVTGKWVAIVSQSALLLATIIPYLILRYFFGGMNLLAELVFLALIFLTSMALTAVTVGLSGCTSVIVRSIIPVLGLPALFVMFIAGIRGGPAELLELLSSHPSESYIAVASYVACLAYIIYTMLSLGASLIAPAAENHSIWRRLLALVAIIVVIPLIYQDYIGEYWHMTIAFIIAVPAILTALTDSAPLVATVSEPFEKRGALGKFVGAFLYPTWTSGILFSLVLGVLTVIAIFIHPDFDETQGSAILLALLGSLYFPAVWQIVFFRGESQRLANYLLILAGSGVMLLILAMVTASMRSAQFLWFFAWNPLTFIAMASDYKMRDVALNGVIAVDCILALLLLFPFIKEAMRKPIHISNDSTPAE